MKSQNQETSPQTPSSPQQSHLALILDTPEKEKFVNRCDSLSSSNSMAYNVSSPSSSTLIGEYIGIESCLDLETSTNHGSCSREKRNQRWAKKKEFPPPIPLLARTENLPSHMPWVLKRYYTGDGRLILREEKVRHHEYFRAHRCNGRLTLHLVPLDDEVSAHRFLFNHERRHDFENDHEWEENESLVEESTEMNVNGNDGVENESLVEESTEMDGNGNDGVENDYCVKNVDSYETLEEEEEEVVHDDKRVPSVESSGSAGKCLNYSSVRTSSTCIFGVPIPAVRPVHS
ncbi:protein FANTASTIC FOUR [Salix suchowensis]|nr:protein FANTASTIC FOUR [Salix suchowensis]